ncbi:hypothetical protein TNIN_78081 [Trichonephila inaurata madagascariensis]|uniref:Uncharacterized protein n=1 Tax=Trichonephila inaurata madagascariensis TaxID=2747483 RepID=A0A8X6YV05_9ARAC|nr:hypothetical protein TNIN_78081 [Trichonephila inaurata madagascariensis]
MNASHRSPLPEGETPPEGRFPPLPETTVFQTHRGSKITPRSRVILRVEDLPGVGSSSHLQPIAHQNNHFSKAAQTDTSGTVNCCF